MKQRDIFISRPTWIAGHYKDGLQNFLSALENIGYAHHTLGTTTYAVGNPLDRVIEIMAQCKGAIVLGYPQLYTDMIDIKGTFSRGEFHLPTEWNHVEATIAHSLGLPVLLIFQKGLMKRGIFDPSAFPVYPYEIDLRDPNWVDLKEIRGALTEYALAISKPNLKAVNHVVEHNLVKCPNHFFANYMQLASAEQKLTHPGASHYCAKCSFIF